MENRRIALKEIIECTDPTRKTPWQVNMHLPIDQEQFEIIEHIIYSLRNISDSYLVVDLSTSLQEMTYIQIRRDNEDLWRLEIHFENPIVFNYKRHRKIYIKKHPWTQKKLYVNNVEEAITIFREVLCNKHIPYLERRTDCTKEIYMERFRQSAVQKG